MMYDNLFSSNEKIGHLWLCIDPDNCYSKRCWVSDLNVVGLTPEWCQLFCNGCILEQDAWPNAHARSWWLRINNRNFLVYMLNRQSVIKVRLLGSQRRPDLPCRFYSIFTEWTLKKPASQRTEKVHILVGPFKYVSDKDCGLTILGKSAMYKHEILKLISNLP